jgi:hypothetical protein
MKNFFNLQRALTQVESEKSVIVHCTPKPSDFYDEAIGLIDFHGGALPQERDWKERCKPYFENRNIEPIHWDTIYYEALTLQTQP